MNKIIFSLLALLLANLTFTFPVKAVSKPKPTAAITTAPIVQTQPIDYALPYPGILPDSPIYILKEIRDQVVGFLITDPVKKSFYFLLLSDKRLAAGQVLITTGKTNLGVTTIAASESYFSQSLDQTGLAKQKGENVGELLSKLTVSALKHDELISGLLPKISGADLEQMTKAHSENQKSQSRVTELSARN